jgi:hypothetical protein
MKRYAVLHYTLCDGWVNFTHDENGKPVTYATREEAQADVDEFMADIAQQIKDGERDPEDGYSSDEFEIGEVEE